MAKNVLDRYYLLITLLITIAYQLFFFAIAWTFKFDKVTDLAGGSNFLVLAVITLLLRAAGENTADIPVRNIVASSFVIIWALRLAGFLFYRILKTGKDDRFDEIRTNFRRFLGFWIFQMIWVFVVSLPVTILNSPGSVSRSLSPSPTESFGSALDIIGTVFYVIGILLETVADQQKIVFRFRRIKREKAKTSPPTSPTRPSHTSPVAKELPFISTGLFRFSRHPNYFGEILLWFGIYLLCLSPLPPSAAQIVTVLSPLLTATILCFLSGLPLNERPVARRYYNLRGDPGREVYKAYVDYRERTSILVPMLPAVYKRVPKSVKRWAFFELERYQFYPERDEQRADKGRGASTEGLNEEDRRSSQ